MVKASRKLMRGLLVQGVLDLCVHLLKRVDGLVEDQDGSWRIVAQRETAYFWGASHDNILVGATPSGRTSSPTSGTTTRTPRTSPSPTVPRAFPPSRKSSPPGARRRRRTVGCTTRCRPGGCSRGRRRRGATRT